MTRPTDLFAEIADLRARGAPAALATVIGVRGSAPARDAMHLLVREDGSARGTVGGGALEERIRELALESIAADESRRTTIEVGIEAADDTEMVCGGAVEVFVEPVTIPTCVLFGAGHLATAIAPVARVAGFRVVVADDRASHASADRFPDADEVIARPFPDVFRTLAPRLGSAAYCVIVTRSHKLDEDCAAACLGTPARYVGMIGSSKKVAHCREGLAGRGVAAADLARLRAPVGLDLDARTHGEIAVAIVAEMIAVRRRAPLAGATKAARGGGPAPVPAAGPARRPRRGRGG